MHSYENVKHEGTGLGAFGKSIESSRSYIVYLKLFKIEQTTSDELYNEKGIRERRGKVLFRPC